MNRMAGRIESLLREAGRLLPRYLEATGGLTHEKKGIRRSELFFFYAFAAPKKSTKSSSAEGCAGISMLNPSQLSDRN